MWQLPPFKKTCPCTCPCTILPPPFFNFSNSAPSEGGNPPPFKKEGVSDIMYIMYSDIISVSVQTLIKY